MGFPVDEHFGPVLRFVDFQYLPDLLRRIRVGDEPETLRAWEQFLDDAGYTDIDDDSDTTPPQLASDAMRLCKGLELLDDEGPTAAGANMARLADTPPEERGEEYDEGLGGMLADQIQTHWRANGLSLASRLRDGALLLADHLPLPGLLLAEVEALIVLAHRDVRLAVDWFSGIARVRDDTRAEVEPLDPDAADTFETLLGEAGVAEVLHDEIATSEMVSEHWFGVMASQSDRTMALTELRATAMLLDFSGLLELNIPTGPVQHLVHPAAN